MKTINPDHDLRQGDPLSTYQFIICAEGLSIMIRRYEEEKNIKGVKVCRKALTITHMFFGDDSYVYSRAKKSDAGKVLELLENFERASGQKVNLQKCTVFFSTI